MHISSWFGVGPQTADTWSTSARYGTIISHAVEQFGRRSNASRVVKNTRTRCQSNALLHERLRPKYWRWVFCSILSPTINFYFDQFPSGLSVMTYQAAEKRLQALEGVFWSQNEHEQMTLLHVSTFYHLFESSVYSTAIRYWVNMNENVSLDSLEWFTWLETLLYFDHSFA